MPEQQYNELPPPGLTKEQKTGFFLLLVFVIITIVLGVLQIRNTMFAPFALNNIVPGNLKDQVNTIDTLRYRDTDKDSLSDFDELYVYGTSPYLRDTFGYGMSDKEVIAKGLPLCPGGKCISEENLARNSSSTNAIVSGVSSSTTMVAEATANAAVLATSLSDPAKIRALLLQSGSISADVLKKISDQDLMITVQQLLTSSTVMNNLQSLGTITQNNAAAP